MTQTKKKKITVRRATYLDGIQRAALMAEGLAEAGPFPEKLSDQMLHYTRTFLFPSLKACSDYQGSYTDFLQLPDQEVEAWVAEAEALNPHWFTIEQDQKKDSK
jgi:hypothetical protein